MRMRQNKWMNKQSVIDLNIEPIKESGFCLNVKFCLRKYTSESVFRYFHLVGLR